ncbi:MAG: large subunit ribosomal protein L32 [Myxococcota bacterium]|jgi:large subunit ribosomal protein L32
MAVPKQKKSKAKKRSRRAPQDALVLRTVSVCTNCAADTLSHRACKECGWYKDRIAVAQPEIFEEDAAEA